MTVPSIPTGRIVDGRAFTGQIFVPQKARAYMAGAQTIADLTTTKVTIDTISYDTAMGFSTTNNNYTVPTTGYYVIQGKVGTTTPNATNILQSWADYIYVNGASVAEGEIASVSQTGINVVRALGCHVGDTVYLNQNDVVDIRFAGNGGGNWVMRTGSDITYVSIHLISV